MRMDKKQIKPRKENNSSFGKKTDSAPFSAKKNYGGAKSAPSFKKTDVRDENSK
jgi:hypothetical protein